MDDEQLKTAIRACLGEQRKAAANVNEILKALNLPPTEKKHLRRLLRQMSAEGDVARLDGCQFALPRRAENIVGVLRTSSKGFGFVMPERAFVQGMEQREIYVPRKRMGDALNNDRVLVRIVGETSRSPEGQVLQVLERGTRDIVGTFYFTKRGGNVIPRDERFNRTLVTGRPDPALGANDGSYVVAEIIDWTPATEPLYGRVVEVLGNPDTPGIDVTMIVRDAGVDPDFAPAVLAEAEAIPDCIPDGEVRRRTDFRAVATFTMDGITAKDFDDALSIERLDDGGWRLGVHIADVAHYVGEGSALDAEAYNRGTSIYPVDRVVPMLPEKLSNHLCSLKPGEDRLTLSCVMDIDSRGRVSEYAIHEGVIRSRHRLVYEDVQAFMDGRAAMTTIRELGEIREQLDALYELRGVLTEMRTRRGALDLDVTETEVVFDDDGAVKELARRQRLGSHRLVEECMLIANEVVASHLFNLHVPCVYRVHEDPDMTKLRQLQPILAHLGIHFPARKDITPDAIQLALDKAGQLETGFIARRLILRAMMRARYHDENLGHYGLGSACYTHFTSPIRRYPDLLVHRILKESMRGASAARGIYTSPGHPAPEQGMAMRHDEQADTALLRRASLRGAVLPAERETRLRHHLGEWTKHCSARERRADDIENSAVTVKTLEYVREFLGETFDGYITSVVPWGFYVELREMPVEGLVHVRNLGDDFYEYDEDRMILVGTRGGGTFKLGDRVSVAVENVNIAALELDFALVERAGGPADVRTGAKRKTQAHIRQRGGRGPQRGGYAKRRRR